MNKKAEFRVIIAGCQDFNDYKLLSEKCDNILGNKQKTHDVIVISGGARGADRLGERYAREHGLPFRVFPADWERDGNSAGPKRNALMAANADALIAFWDGASKGTKNMIEIARSRGLLIRVIQYAPLSQRFASSEPSAPANTFLLDYHDEERHVHRGFHL